MNENETQRIAAAINALPGEQWALIPGTRGLYAVSSFGRVYSTPRERTKGGLMAWVPDNYGYPRVNVTIGGRNRKMRVHLLVARAFLGPTPDGMEVRHLDGNASNPALSNLAYGTHQENGMDTVRHGANCQANKTHCPRNHPYDEANTLVSAGRRYCRMCRRERRSTA